MTADPTTTLAAHRYRPQVTQEWPFVSRCRCGWTGEHDGWDTRVEAQSEHDRHVLAVLAQEGWAVVKLPEADGDDGVNVSWKYASMWHGQNVVSAYIRRNHDYTPDEARAMAADLLAAANAASGVVL